MREPLSPAASGDGQPAAGEQRVLLVRLPCNPIFPVGPIYLVDHLHKQFPSLAQQLLDLAAVPVLDVKV
ncbi:MAG: radical SAM protein, partial [Cyanobium sp.]